MNNLKITTILLSTFFLFSCNDKANNKSAETEAYYAEYNSYGVGGRNLEGRVSCEHILNKDEVQKYKIEKILVGKDNWKYSFDK